MVADLFKTAEHVEEDQPLLDAAGAVIKTPDMRKAQIRAHLVDDVFKTPGLCHDIGLAGRYVVMDEHEHLANFGGDYIDLIARAVGEIDILFAEAILLFYQQFAMVANPTKKSPPS